MICDRYPPFGDCTGHGVCSDKGLCKCDVGWSSIGDFSTKVGDHCGINISALRALWVIALSVFLYLFYLCGKSIKERGVNTQQQQQHPQTRSNKRQEIWIILKEPAAILPIYFLLTSICALVLAILRIIDPIKYSIALHPISTALLFFFCVFGVHGGCVYLLLLINFMDGYAKIMSSKAGQTIRDQSNMMRFVAFVIMIYAPLPHAPPLFNITNPGHDRESMIVYSIAMILLFAFLGLPLLRYLFIISLEFKSCIDVVKNNINYYDNSPNNINNMEKFEKAKQKIDKALIVVFFSVGFSISQYLIFIFVPFVSIMSSYIFPILILGVGVVGIIFNWNIMQKSNNRKLDKGLSDSQRLIHDNIIASIRSTGNTIDLPKPSSPSSIGA